MKSQTCHTRAQTLSFNRKKCSVTENGKDKYCIYGLNGGVEHKACRLGPAYGNSLSSPTDTWPLLDHQLLSAVVLQSNISRSSPIIMQPTFQQHHFGCGVMVEKACVIIGLSQHHPLAALLLPRWRWS